jgi:hypothetical protein
MRGILSTELLCMEISCIGNRVLLSEKASFFNIGPFRVIKAVLVSANREAADFE